ncbi:hypothetical protein HYT32_00425 [Candidatus Roizmanbacteria bacterium]|nr:hypothetical protein [Candidatus Roizmanbacteria bacterium]
MQKGYIALITVLIVMAVVLTTASTVALLGIGEAQSGFSIFRGEDTLSFVEGCAEDAMLKARVNASYNGGTITRPEGSCAITVVSKIGSPTVTWTINITTADTLYKRTVEIVFERSETGITLTSWKEI